MDFIAAHGQNLQPPPPSSPLFNAIPLFPPQTCILYRRTKKKSWKKESLSIRFQSMGNTVLLRRQNKTGNNTHHRFVDHPCRKQSISHQLALERKTCSGFALLIVKSGLGYFGILFFRRLVIWVEKKGSRVVNLGNNRGGNVN